MFEEQAAENYFNYMKMNSAERMSGFPMPDLYNQHYINKYSFPKGLVASRKNDESKKKQKTSIYDMHTQPVRRGISGWKLTKRALANPSQQQQSPPAQSRNKKGVFPQSMNNGSSL